jgi:hypothetical protein
MLSQFGAQSTSHKWVSLYKNQEDVIPEWVVGTVTLRLLNLVLFNLVQNSREPFPIQCWVRILYPYGINTKCKKCITTHGFFGLDDMGSGRHIVMR